MPFTQALVTGKLGIAETLSSDWDSQGEERIDAHVENLHWVGVCSLMEYHHLCYSWSLSMWGS